MDRLLSFLIPAQASNLAPGVDRLFYSLIALCGGVALLVAIVSVFFCIRYRSGSKVSRAGGNPNSFPWEIAWTVLPLFIFIGVFYRAAKVYFQMSRPPTDAEAVYVVAKQWMWKVQHLDGRREINELHIPVGRTVKLVMTSQDVIHDFFVPAFRTKHDVLPGRYTTVWFRPTQPGRYHLFCSQYCGLDHATMGGWVYVMSSEEHSRWLAGVNPPESLAAQGEHAFQQFGCSGCHSLSSKIPAPALEGIYDKPVPLADGTVVT
ncbi:MAG: cytochrome c oxidase, subunit, partial [Verrucomicrobiales bacterium]|nr:cytochrome c oxidase, subunit [Verrucomicrobiales bacterium]